MWDGEIANANHKEEAEDEGKEGLTLGIHGLVVGVVGVVVVGGFGGPRYVDSTGIGIVAVVFVVVVGETETAREERCDFIVRAVVAGSGRMKAGGAKNRYRRLTSLELEGLRNWRWTGWPRGFGKEVGLGVACRVKGWCGREGRWAESGGAVCVLRREEGRLTER